LRAWFAAAVVLLLTAAGLVFFFWSSRHELAAVITKLDLQDPGWRLEDIENARRRVPDERNSGVVVTAAAKLLAGQAIIVPAMEATFENLPPQLQLTEEQRGYLEKRLAGLTKAVLEGRKLKELPEGRYPIRYTEDYIGTLVPHGQDVREVCELLRWDAARRAEAGDADGALASCLAMLHAARSAGDEPVLISQLIRSASNGVAVGAIERALAQGHLTGASEPALRRLQEALARETAASTLVAGLRGERAGMHELLRAFAEGKFSVATYKAVGKAIYLLQGLAGAKVQRNVASDIDATLIDYFPGYVARQHAAVLRFLTDAVEAAKLPPAEAQKQFQALADRLRDEPLLVRTLAPAFLKVRESQCRTQANLRCALAAVAAERYRLKQGAWPESLDVLVKSGLLDAVPTNPFDGQPIRLVRAGEGLIIQCGEGNSAVINRDRPLDSGNALGFRLWEPSRRRQPHPPAPKDTEAAGTN
jgi:hypothetical protein